MKIDLCEYPFCVYHAVPGPPSFLRITNSNLNNLTLEWGPPNDRNGHLTGYILKYQQGEPSHLPMLRTGCIRDKIVDL